MPASEARELRAAVDVRSMSDRFDVCPPAGLVDAVHDPEVSAAGAVQANELESERPADPVWVLGQGAVDELDGGAGNLLGYSAQGPLRWRGPLDGVRLRRHTQRALVRPSASSLVNGVVWPLATSASAWRISAITSG